MLSEIIKLLPDHRWLEHIQYFDTIDSTNTYAKQLAANGAPEGTVIIAGQQTGGRGRLGRSFSSPAGMGVYLSVILRPGCTPEALMHLTCAAGLFSSEAIAAATGQKPAIKWTNDLILSRRKLGGILTELSVDPKTGLVNWAIVGIGINCCQKPEDFPPDLREIAISLGLPPSDRPRLYAALIQAFCTMCNTLFTQKQAIMEQFRQRCITIGQEISILQADRVRHGTAIDIDDAGGLLVEFPDGTVETVASGEVSVRGMYGYV